MAYFDHNATTPLSATARAAWLHAADESWRNPSSLYRSAARVRNLLENARAQVATILGAQPDRLIFTSGATEGSTLLFQHLSSRSTQPLLLSPFEHPCGVAAAERFFAGRTRHLELDRGGLVDLETLQSQIAKERPALVSVMAANNETGMIQPWKQVAEICRKSGVPFHCDASQWVGKLPASDFGRCSFVTASAHKFGGPKGTGFLLIPQGENIRGQAGGEQEGGMRGGTEDYPSIAAMTAALDETDRTAQNLDAIAARVDWRRRFEGEVLRRISGAKVVGAGNDRLWNTVMVILPTGRNDRWVTKLDRRSFEVSTGSACSSGDEEPSHVLAALGFSPDESRRAIRVSSGWETDEKAWQALADAIAEVHEEMRDDGGDALTQVVRV